MLPAGIDVSRSFDSALFESRIIALMSLPMDVSLESASVARSPMSSLEDARFSLFAARFISNIILSSMPG
jgi:hypothetical protein